MEHTDTKNMQKHPLEDGLRDKLAGKQGEGLGDKPEVNPGDNREVDLDDKPEARFDDKLDKKLERYIIPNTPPKVFARYRALLDEACAYDFGVLENNIIVLDTETTGLSQKSCALTQISAMRLEKGKSVADSKWFTTFVNPHQPIPPEIEELTHIYARDVAAAPDAKVAVNRLAAFVDGAPIIAHNASFDKGFVEAAKEGSPVSTHWVDTLALSRIAFPSLATHKLSDLAQLFSCDGVTHRANDDVCALAGVWHMILCGLYSLPLELLETLCVMHEDVAWQYRFIFEELYRKKGGKDPKKLHYVIPCIRQIRRRLFSGENVDENETRAGVDVSAVDAAHDTHVSRDGDAARAARDDAPTSVRAHWRCALQDLDHEFERGGTLGRVCGDADFEPRPEQLEMAHVVAKAQAEKRISIIEAGCGIGKSFAYLIPSVLHALATGEAVGIATRTNTLANQLISSDLPRLARAYNHAFSYLIAKGYNHYPSLEKIEALIRGSFDHKTIKQIRFSRSKVESEILTTIALVLAASCECSFVDIDSLGIRWNMLYRPWFVSSTRNEGHVRGRELSHFFIDELRARARTHNILITNHALLLSDIACNHNIFPEINNWVVDEAHALSEQAQNTWTEEISTTAFLGALAQLGDEKHGLLSGLMAKKPGACANGVVGPTSAASIVSTTSAASATSSADAGVLTSAQDDKTSARALSSRTLAQILRARDALVEKAEQAFSSLQTINLLDYSHTTNQDFGEREVSARVSAEMRASDGWCAFEELTRDMADDLHTLIKFMQQLLMDATREKEFEALSLLQHTLDTLLTFDLVCDRIRTSEEEGYVCVLERNFQQSKPNIKIQTIPLAPGSFLQSMWYKNVNSIVFTSATLSSGHSFRYFKQSVGVERAGAGASAGVTRGEDAEYVQDADCIDYVDPAESSDYALPAPTSALPLETCIDSPFDYAHAMSLVIPENLKEPGEVGYKEALVKFLFDVHVAMGGSVLTLFTSKKDMQSCAEALSPLLAREGLDLLVQNKAGAHAGLMNKFKREEASSLMALKSFWEGIDAPGKTLRCVVIVRLPFLSPHDPVCEALAAANPRSWWEYVLPHAIIETRQAAGRLIRRQDDTGFVILADTRILHKSYGKHVISSLPNAPLTRINTERIGQYIEMWQRSHA